ncbi:hypothetical protein [Herminiimonas arsenitoxidans]|uniref:hypothetical protein n=1 Tax=Herminiimonas arsenitoxidans TaxID=1809410 RepID=UPI000971461D|nr:hypothetical protein [Herminiimonas arsenitoxidans]
MDNGKDNKASRGHDLDLLLDQELALMLSDISGNSPISFSSLTKRLGLNSRSTLHTKDRKEKIRQAIDQQFAIIGTASDGKFHRKSQADRILDLEKKNALLQAALDHQIEMVCRVIANATAKGWDVDFLLRPLMPNNRQLVRG